LVQPIKRVVIIGPESTGKSTLSRQLAVHFDTTFADEFARGYLETLGRSYNREDLAIIAKGQMVLEEQAVSHAKNGVVFLDTDLHVVKVWSESKYGTCDEEILQQIAERRYDMYILTDIDMIWEEDPLREHSDPEARRYFFDIYQDIVLHSGLPFAVVSGNEKERLKIAIAAVQRILK
jgi:NadR type nicotinamide-nucleotide adenylyltransferase